MPEGRATVSLTQDADAVVTLLMDRFAFAERMDVARLGAAVAVARGLDPSRAGSLGAPGGTTWSLGSLDRDGDLRELVKAMYPDIDEDPGVTLETLINRGLTELGDLLERESADTLAELVAACAPGRS
jgi:hypothetical protein